MLIQFAESGNFTLAHVVTDAVG